MCPQATHIFRLRPRPYVLYQQHNVYSALIVFLQANNFDCKQKTLLKMFSRWLVAVYDHTLEGSLWLEETCADDLDNVVVVAFPEFRDDSSIKVRHSFDSVC